MASRSDYLSGSELDKHYRDTYGNESPPPPRKRRTRPLIWAHRVSSSWLGRSAPATLQAPLPADPPLSLPPWPAPAAIAPDGQTAATESDAVDLHPAPTPPSASSLTVPTLSSSAVPLVFCPSRTPNLDHDLYNSDY